MGRDGTGEEVFGEIEGLEVAAELEGVREGTGEGHGGELEAEDAALLVVPASDSGELFADVDHGGVGEGPGGEHGEWVGERVFDSFETLDVVF